MRRASTLAFALVLTLVAGGGAAAKDPSVTGDASYVLFGYDYSVSLGAHAGDPPNGSVHWHGAFGHWFDGAVTCVSIDGSDAWLSGPVTDTDLPMFSGFVVRVHDGGTPGSAGDMAVTFVYVDLADAMKACQKTSRQIDRYLTPVTEGNLSIH